jgi:hypothetical protein
MEIDAFNSRSWFSVVCPSVETRRFSHGKFANEITADHSAFSGVFSAWAGA